MCKSNIIKSRIFVENLAEVQYFLWQNFRNTSIYAVFQQVGILGILGSILI